MHLHRVRSVLVRQPSLSNVVGFQPPLLQMPAEVLDLISDFLMQLDTSTPRSYDPNLDKNCRSLQSLRHTCRKMVLPTHPLTPFHPPPPLHSSSTDMCVVPPLLPPHPLPLLPPLRMSSPPQPRPPL